MNEQTPSFDRPDAEAYEISPRAETERIDFEIVRLLWQAEECSRSIKSPEGVPESQRRAVAKALNVELANTGLERHHAVISAILHELPPGTEPASGRVHSLIEHQNGGRIATDENVIIEQFEFDEERMEFYVEVSLVTPGGKRSGDRFKVFPGEIMACVPLEIVGMDARREFCAQYVPEFIEWLDALPAAMTDQDLLYYLRLLRCDVANISTQAASNLAWHMDALIAARHTFDNVTSTVKLSGEILNTKGGTIGAVANVPPRQMKLTRARMIWQAYPGEDRAFLSAAIAARDLSPDHHGKTTGYMLPVESIQHIRSVHNTGRLTDYLVADANWPVDDMQRSADRIEAVEQAMRRNRPDFAGIADSPYVSLVEARSFILDRLGEIIDAAAHTKTPARYIADHLSAITEAVPDLERGMCIAVRDVEELFAASRTNNSAGTQTVLPPLTTVMGRYESITAVWVDRDWIPVITLSGLAIHRPDGATSVLEQRRQWHVPIDEYCELLQVSE